MSAKRRRRRSHAPRKGAARASRAAAPPPPPPPKRGRLARFAELYGFEPEHLRTPTLALLAVGTVVAYLGRGAAVPFAVLYLTRHAGIALAFVAVAIAVEQTTRALLSPVFGGLSDRYGRRPFMALGLAFQAVTIPAYLLVTGPTSYLVVSVLAGLGQAPYQPALGAFIADAFPASRRVGAFGLVHMTKNLGWSLGVALGALLVKTSWVVLFVTGGVLPAIYAVLVLAGLKEPSRRESAGAGAHPLRSATTALRSAPFVLFLLAATAVFVSWGQEETVLPVFIGDGLALGEAWVSAIFLGTSVLIVLFQVPVGAMAERWPRTRALVLSTLLTAVAFLVLGVAALLQGADRALAARATLAAGALALTLAEMIETPVVFAMAADLAPPGMTGGAMGVLSLAAPLGMGAAPLLAGLASSALGWAWAWAVLAGVLVVAAVLFALHPGAPQDAEAAAGPKGAKTGASGGA